MDKLMMQLSVRHHMLSMMIHQQDRGWYAQSVTYRVAPRDAWSDHERIISVWSVCTPQITAAQLYIRGTHRSLDSIRCHYSCDTHRDAVRLQRLYLAALMHTARRLNGDVMLMECGHTEES